MHIMREHDKVKPFQCNECAYSSSQNCDIRKHTIVVHTKVKTFQCNQCDFATSMKGQLEQHFDCRHSREKHIKCYKCDYSASIKKYLQTHLATIHLKEKDSNATIVITLHFFRQISKGRYLRNTRKINFNVTDMICYLSNCLRSKIDSSRFY